MILFFNFNTFPLQQEWGVEVSPHGIAIEIGAVYRSPRGVQAMADEVVLWIRPLGDQCSIHLLDRNGSGVNAVR